MMRTYTILSFAAALALSAGACSSDSSDSGNGHNTGNAQGDDDSSDDDTGGDDDSTPSSADGGKDAGKKDGGAGGSTNIDAGSGTTVHPDAGSAKDAGGADAGSTTDASTSGLDGSVVVADASTDAGPPSSDDSDFNACYAKLKDTCVASEMNTAELMQTPCKALTGIPIPLSDGGTYGPVTIPAGPYGGQIDWNQGTGTEFVNQVNALEDICDPIGIETFNEPQSVNAEIENLRDVDWSLYTIFRPACFKDGETYPVITWANGTCGEIAGYSSLLSIVASYGYVVIAANSTWTATSPTDTVQLRALDYAKALNEDSKSIYYKKLDMDHIGAMGHSQGAFATSNADSDPRVKALIFWNTGTSNNKPFLDISGERDVVSTTPDSMASDVNAATQPGGWLFFHQVLETGGSSTGHLTLMEQPDRVVDLAVAWWDWQLKGSEDAKKMFVGDDCGLCKTPDQYEYGHNSLLQ